MMAILYKCILGLFGSIGFALVFRLRIRHIGYAAVGGFLSTLCYLYLIETFSASIFLSSFVSSALIALYADTLAVRLRVPAVGIWVTSIIPIVPGRDLYYTMESVVQNEWHEASILAINCVMCTLGLALGISMIFVILQMIRNRRNLRKKSR